MSQLTTRTKTAHRILELDGLRGISVMLVVIFHLSNFSGYVTVPKFALSLLANLGVLGVQIFFVISGFVITKLLIAEHDRTGRISLRGFYTRRFFRIIPAYWAYSFSVVILSYLGVLVLKQEGVPQITGFLVSSLFLSDIFYPSWFWGHTWSLSVEEQFYIFFPMIFRTLFKGMYRDTIMAVFLVLIYISPCFAGPFIDLLFWAAHLISSHVDWYRYIRPEKFFNYPYITAGVVMAVYWDSISTALRRLPGFICLLLVLVVALWPLVSGVEILGYFLPSIRPLAVGATVGWIVVNPGYFGFLRWQITQLLGACSYSIYMWQQMFTGEPYRYGPGYPRSLWISLFLIFACAGLSYFVIERNFIILGRRVTANSSRGHPPPTVEL